MGALFASLDLLLLLSLHHSLVQVIFERRRPPVVSAANAAGPLSSPNVQFGNSRKSSAKVCSNLLQNRKKFPKSVEKLVA